MNLFLILALVGGGLLSSSLLVKYLLAGESLSGSMNATKLARAQHAMDGIAALSASGLAVLLLFILMSPV